MLQTSNHYKNSNIEKNGIESNISLYKKFFLEKNRQIKNWAQEIVPPN